MSGSAAIKAGAAFVELFTDASKLDRGLNQAAAKCKAWGSKVRNIGAAIFAAGSAVLGGIGALASQAAEIGGMFNDLSQKSGASVESLSLLKFAADQCGSTIEAVGGGITKMQKNLAAASGGNKEAAATFEDLGMNVGELMKLTPDEQFLRMADAIAKIDDPAKRTAAAMKVFGKSGADLLPLLNQGSEAIRGFMNQAETLGLKLSTKEAQALDDFGDAWGAVKEQAIRAAVGIGGALAPTLTDVATKIQTLMVDVIEWIKNNQDTIISTAKLVVEVTAAGAALMILGQVISTVGTVITGFNTLLQFSIAHAKGMGVALAAVGIMLFAQQVYAANDAVRKLNEEMERSQGLNSKMAKQQMREQRQVMDEAGGLQGDEKTAFLKDQLEMAEKNQKGLADSIKEQRRNIDVGVRTRNVGNKITAEREQAIKDTQQQEGMAADFVQTLKDALRDAQKPKTAPPTTPSSGKTSAEDKEMEDFKKKAGKAFDVGGSSAGPEKPQSPFDKVFQGQRDQQRFEMQQAIEARDKAIADAKKAKPKNELPGHAKLPNFGPKEMEKVTQQSMGTFSAVNLGMSFGGGAGAAAEQTARNTKEMVKLQHDAIEAIKRYRGGFKWNE